MATEAFHRMMIFRALFEFLRGQQAGERAFRGKRSRRNRIQPDVVTRPFHRERTRQREYARFSARGRNDEARPGIHRGVGGDDIQNVSGLLLGYPFSPQGQRAEECALQHDAHYRVERVR